MKSLTNKIISTIDDLFPITLIGGFLMALFLISLLATNSYDYIIPEGKSEVFVNKKVELMESRQFTSGGANKNAAIFVGAEKTSKPMSRISIALGIISLTLLSFPVIISIFDSIFSTWSEYLLNRNRILSRKVEEELSIKEKLYSSDYDPLNEK